ncbi:MAG: hypothetical protein ABI921_00220 [Panacibacter sp.]
MEITANISLKELRKKEQEQKELKQREICEAYAAERFGIEKLNKLTAENKGLWFLVVWNEFGDQVEVLALMKPVTRQVLSYASTKMTDEGLYGYLETAMRDCFIDGDMSIIEDDNYFLPASNSFQKIMEGKKTSLLKR